MATTMAPNIPLREHSHLDFHANGRDAPPEQAGMEDRICPGCKKSAVSEQGGLVVAFGQSFFHVDCFKCAKCSNQVTADTNLLLLTDGSPICSNCSFSCNVCHTLILDEAIMAGDDSYHAHCFKCKVCKNRIDELVFAKTSQGIYCMNCHNERMIKIRNYTQKKAEKNRAGGSSSAKSRERDARQYHHDNGVPSPAYDEQSRPGSSRMQSSGLNSDGSHRSSHGADNNHNSTRTRPHSPYTNDSYFPSHSLAAGSLSGESSHPPPPFSHHYASKQTTLPLPSGSLEGEQDGRRRSYDDGVRPLDVLLKQNSYNSSQTSLSSVKSITPTVDTLSIDTSNRAKRRSINPGLSISPADINAAGQSSSAALSPRSEKSYSQRVSYSAPTPPYSESTSATSPLHEQFQQPSASSSQNNNYQSYSNGALPEKGPHLFPRSRSPSIIAYEGHDLTVVLPPQPSGSDAALQSPPPYTFVRPLPTPGRSDSGRWRSGGLSPTTGAPSYEDHSRPGTPSRQASVSSLSIDHRRSGSGARSSSPVYHSDISRGVEGGTDTEPAVGPTVKPEGHSPPVPPPKDARTETSLSSEGDMSTMSQSGSGSDELSELPSIEQTSRATFIAPALPPIRFSMNANDFSDMLNSVGGSHPTLEALAKLSPPSSIQASATPTPMQDTVSTPSSDTTVFPHSSAPSIERSDAEVISKHHDFTRTTPDTPSQLMEKRTSNSSQSERSQQASSPSTSLDSTSSTRITLTGPGSSVATVLRHDSTDAVTRRLREMVQDVKEHGTSHLQLETEFAETILETLESRKKEITGLKSKVDGMKRTSKQYIEGMSVAQVEYDRELKGRRDAETEVTRLRVLLSGQAARLTALSGESRRQELRQQLSKELNDSLSGLEVDLSRLKLERDMTLAEVEELSVTRNASNGSSDAPSTNISRSLTKRMENIRSQYHHDLIPLTQQRETLNREIAELKAVRDTFLEETTVLNARNEELAQLSAVYARRMDSLPENASKPMDMRSSFEKGRSHGQTQPSLIAPSLSSSTSGSSTAYDEVDSKYFRAQRPDVDFHTPSKGKFMKWPGSRAKDVFSPSNIPEVGRKASRPEHNFQQLSVLRFTKCDHCGDKMWGSQLRCTICNTSIHVRCAGALQISCTYHANPYRDDLSQGPLPPSMFGRDLTEQVRADSKEEERNVPVIVEKCIDAVETLALDYEGIYRKTGGSGQTKAITQLFERGDYSAFDLRDSDRFNDICSVTSVLKTYFRSLPVPLLTFDLHDQFMSAIAIRDQAVKHQSLQELVDKLPNEHYYTLRSLMIHLHHVRLRCEKNLMNARNLGVVFGPTLLKSRDPGSEFSDMAGKALFIEWLVDNAPQIFNDS